MPKRILLRAGALAAVAAAVVAGTALLAPRFAEALVLIEVALTGLALWTYVPAFDPFRQDGHRLARRDAVALTFDDGPDPAVTRRILDALTLANAQATFFVTGERAASAPELIREMARSGHEVGCHGWSHKRLGWTRPRVIEDEVSHAFQKLTEIIGVPPRLFRAPYGTRGPWLYGALRRRAMRSAAWSLGAWDAVPTDARAIARRVLGRVRGGDVVVLHDASAARGPEGARAATADALPAILEGLAARGLMPIALSADTVLLPSRLGTAVRVAAGLTASALAAKLVFGRVTHPDFVRALHTLHPAWLVAAAALAILTTFVRSRQLALVIDPEDEAGVVGLAAATFGATALNTVLPFRWGEVARAGWLSRLTGRSLARVARSMVLEKTFEGATLGLVAGLAAPAPWPVVTACVSGAAVLGAHIWTPPLARMALFCMTRWLLEIGVLVTALRATNIVLDPFQGALAVIAVNVVIAVPSAPANLGVLEAALALTLERLGVQAPIALAGAIVYHLADVLPGTAIGLASLPYLSHRRAAPFRAAARPGEDERTWSPSLGREIAARATAFATLLVTGGFLPRRRRHDRSLVRDALAWMGPDVAMLAAMSLALALLTWARCMTPPTLGGWSELWMPLAALAMVPLGCACAAWRDVLCGRPVTAKRFSSSVIGALRDWLPVVLLLLLDPRLEGAWVLQPIALGAFLLVRGRRDRFRELVSAVVLVTYAGFFLDRIVPSGTASHLPSLPCALVSVGAGYAWRNRRVAHPSWVLPSVITPIAVAQCVAMVYLLHHGIVDVVAGIALGAVGAWLNAAMVRRWPHPATPSVCAMGVPPRGLNRKLDTLEPSPDAVAGKTYSYGAPGRRRQLRWGASTATFADPGAASPSFDERARGAECRVPSAK